MTSTTSRLDDPVSPDLLHRLGDIPESRVLRHPPPGQATEADALALAEAADKRLCELVDATLVEKPVGYAESRVAVRICRLLDQFVDEHDLGAVTGADGLHRLFPGSVRIPDVAFASWARFPDGYPPPTPLPDFAPDLAVEVLSPSNTRREMERKRRDYFQAGVQIVWEVDARARVVDVYPDPDTCERLAGDDVLEGGSVLPGLEVPLPDIFRVLDRREPPAVG